MSAFWNYATGVLVGFALGTTTAAVRFHRRAGGTSNG